MLNLQRDWRLQQRNDTFANFSPNQKHFVQMLARLVIALMLEKSKCHIPLYFRLEYNSFESNAKPSKTGSGLYWATSDSKSSLLTLNTCKHAINARILYCDFVDLSQSSLLQRRFDSKWGSKSKLLSRIVPVQKMVLYIKLT